MDRAWAEQEFAGAILPDRRFLRSLPKIADRLASASECSYTQALGHDGRQAARRLMRNPSVDVDGIMEGHYQQTAQRAMEYPVVLALQDTCVLNYDAHHAKSALGPIDERKDGRGLFAHDVFIVTPDGLPLGVMDVAFWTRKVEEHGKGKERRAKPTHLKESQKWLDAEQKLRVQELLPQVIQQH